MKTAFIGVLALAVTASAQSTFTDPANLRGERVSPRTGRELPIDQGSRGLEQMLRKLSTRASLMLIVAHPDDEDGGMLTLYSRGLGARVADLSLTRGEGGQNAMTGDFEDALGLIRTQELLSSDRYTGVDQFFGTEVDFGFSKTREEAFAKWTHERVLYDAVRAVRLYRPLVIAAVFIGGVTDGHGQHQVSGEIAQEVFKAAGDPKVFPELTAEGILPWQPLKVYARVPMQAITPQGLFDYATDQYTPARFTNYVTGEVTATAPSVDVVIHEGQTDPLLSTCAANRADLSSTFLASLSSRNALEGSASSTSANAPCQPLSYVQFARIGLGLQKTQIGPGVRLAAPGAFDIGYHRYGSRLSHQPEHEQSFFDGIDTSIRGIADLAANPPHQLVLDLDTLMDLIQNATDQAKSSPQNLAPSLAMALQSTDSIIRSLASFHLSEAETTDIAHELRIKRTQLNDALADALGLSVSTQLETDKPDECMTAIFPSCIAQVNTIVRNGSTAPVQVVSDFTSYTGTSDHERKWGQRTLAAGERLWPERSSFEEGWLPSGRVVTGDPSPAKSLELLQAEGRPYFSRRSIEQPYYDLSDPALRLSPATPSDAFWTRFSYKGSELLLGHIITTSTSPSDPGVPLVMAPALSITLPSTAIAIPRDDGEIRIDVSVHNSARSSPPGGIELKTPPNWLVHTATDELLPPLGANVTKTFAFTVKAQTGTASTATISAIADTATGSYKEGYRFVGYPGLVPTPLYTKAETRIVPVDLRLPTCRRIAYLPGTGDAVPEALASIGLPVTMLKVADLTPAYLAQFHTIILGVRTYNAHPDLHGTPTQALLDFARNGGNVIVQYQTPEFTAADAPYSLALGPAEKVVDEAAPVELLEPAAPVFTAPNRLTSADFNGWIEERGHDFLQTWDPHYTALTETHDPSQAPQEGGLLTAQLGRGHWTYCAFALYRQLPEAVPGAFRIFVNLLGLADAPSH